MPITTCPSCGASLEVPSVVPGGQVACPYCGAEFPAQKQARPARGAVRRGGGRKGAPRRGGGRPAPGRGRGRKDEYEDEGYGGSRGYRKKTDPVPLILFFTAFLVFGGVAFWVLTKDNGKDEETDEKRISSVEMELPAYYDISSRSADRPEKEPLEMPDIFLVKDRITLRRQDFSGSVIYTPPVGKDEELYQLSYTVTMKEREGEHVIEVEDGQATHEGHYDILSFYWMGTLKSGTDTTIDARFKTDRYGMLVPGTFTQTGGATLNPAPEFIANRGFNVLPRKAVRAWETWGTDNLPDPLTPHLVIGGQPLRSILPNMARRGGWRIEGGKRVKLSDGSWDRSAAFDMQLLAAEHAPWTAITFHGQPAEISAGIVWKGRASYMLKKQLLVKVNPMSMDVDVKVRTANVIHRWAGHATWNFEMFKDP